MAVPSKRPSSTYARKLAVVLGARFASSATTIGPSDVRIRTRTKEEGGGAAVAVSVNRRRAVEANRRRMRGLLSKAGSACECFRSVGAAAADAGEQRVILFGREARFLEGANFV